MHTRLVFPLAAVLLAPPALPAQSLLDRSPNVSGDWAGAPGTLYFHFVHRFSASDGPEKKVSNVPTFLLAAGLPKRLLAGFNYSTNSTLAPSFPNEWELFARWAPLSQDLGAPLDLGAQVAYNNAADGVDGELSIGKTLGTVRLILAGRALSDPLESGNKRFAAAVGATARLGQHIALAGDVGSLIDRDSTEKVAWGAGLHFAIPLTPHTVSLHASNVMITTLQGASRGGSAIRYGFEFTIPLTLRRYFGSRGQQSGEADSALAVPAAEAEPAPAAPARPDTVAAVPVRPANPQPRVAPADTARARATPPATPSNPPVRTPPGAPRTTATPRPAPPAAPSTRPAPPKPAARVMKTGIKNVSYLQPRLQIQIGTTVEWTNNDPMPHTVTATDKSFNSGLINPGRTYRHTFTKAGTFSFFCMPHPFMKGVIVVRDQ